MRSPISCKVACAALLIGMVARAKADTSIFTKPGKRNIEYNPNSEFLENSYVELVPYKWIENNEVSDQYTTGLWWPYLIEGRLAPHLFIFDNKASVLLDDTAPSRKSMDFAFTPEFVLRMFNTYSVPVRRPSFRPSFNFNRSYYYDMHKKADSTLSARIWNWRAKFIHYSDGAEGCLFRQETRTTGMDPSTKLDTSGCTDTPSDLHGLNVNLLDGEYSSTFLVFGLDYQRIQTDSDGIERASSKWSAEVEYHPGDKWYDLLWWGNWMPGAETPTQRKIYNNNLATRIMYENYSRDRWLFQRLRVSGQIFPLIMAYTNPDYEDAWVCPYDLEVEVSNVPRWKIGRFDFFKGYSWFLKLNVGQDLYNVSFRNQIVQFSVGLSSQSPFDFKLGKQAP